MTRPKGRTANCSPADAEFRLREARDFLEVAEIADSPNVAVSNAVLAGIAACDAACCSALGIVSRGQDHRQATTVLADVQPGGREAATNLRRLLNLKEASQYGAKPISETDRRGAIRQAGALVRFADDTLGS
jgi:hypothetical protein